MKRTPEVLLIGTLQVFNVIAATTLVYIILDYLV